MSKVSFNNLPVGAKFRCKDRTFIKTASEIYPTSVPLDRRTINSICLYDGHRMVFGKYVPVEVIE